MSSVALFLRLRPSAHQQAIKLALVSSLSLATWLAVSCGGGSTAPAAPPPATVPVAAAPPPQPAAPTISISVSPSTITAGNSTIVTWSTTNATAVSIDNNIGSQPANGSITISPVTSTVFHATATGPGGTQSAAVNVIVSVPPPNTNVNVPTWHMDNQRSGLNSNEIQLTPASVKSGNFTRLFSYLVDGYIYAQPLYVSHLSVNGATRNVVFVATESLNVYAFDADNFGNGAPLWKISLLQSGETPQPGGNPKPFQGLTSTPAIDLNSNTMYLVSSQRANAGTFFRLHALDITTGAERSGSPVVIHASVPGTNAQAVNGTITLTPSCIQRAAILLSGGTLYLGFSACPTGWLLSYNAASLTQIGVRDMSPNANGYGEFGGAGGVWMGGGGPVADQQGNVYVSTGNGPYDGGPEWGDSVLKLDSRLNVVDHFTPFDFAYLQCRDLDLSAGGLMLIPGTGQLLAGGKAGKMYLLNAANLGGVQSADAGAAQTFWFDQNNHGQGRPCTDNLGNTLTGEDAPYGIYATAAWWNGSVYLGSTPGVVRQFQYRGGQLVPASATSESIADLSYGTTPFISANGTSNGIVWVLDHGHPIQDPLATTPATATLRAYDATNLSSELYNSSQNPADVPGFGIKFTSPIVSNGKVFIPTAHDPLTTANPEGELDIYGLKQ